MQQSLRETMRLSEMVTLNTDGGVLSFVEKIDFGGMISSLETTVCFCFYPKKGSLAHLDSLVLEASQLNL